MEVNFKKQLLERQEFVDKLLKEMKEKEREFEEYCRQVEIDRKLSFNYFLNLSKIFFINIQTTVTWWNLS
jgi:hypothetical protein